MQSAIMSDLKVMVTPRQYCRGADEIRMQKYKENYTTQISYYRTLPHHGPVILILLVMKYNG